MTEADAADRAVTLEGLERLRARARESAHASWIPMLVFGALVTGAIPFALAGEDGWDGFYWLVAGPVGGLITWAVARRRGVRVGIVDTDRSFRLHAAIIAAMVVGALAIGWGGADSAFSEAGTLYPIAAGMVAIGAINRIGLVALAGAAIAAWATGVLIAGPGETAAWAYAGEGAILLAAGAITLARTR